MSGLEAYRYGRNAGARQARDLRTYAERILRVEGEGPAFDFIVDSTPGFHDKAEGWQSGFTDGVLAAFKRWRSTGVRDNPAGNFITEHPFATAAIGAGVIGAGILAVWAVKQSVDISVEHALAPTPTGTAAAPLPSRPPFTILLGFPRAVRTA